MTTGEINTASPRAAVGGDDQPPGPPPTGNGSGAPRHAKPPGERKYRWVLEWVVVLVVAVVVAIGARTYVVQTYSIPSGSMEPTLMIGDRILVDKLAFHLHSVDRGDIVVFREPDDHSICPTETDLVKRVIGLPGEHIASGPRGEVLINGHSIPQPWLEPSALTNPGPAIKPQTVPPGHYFVMGDNRGLSCDSRYFGPIASSLIVGKADLRIWPLSRIGGL